MWGTAGQLKEVEAKTSGTVNAASLNPSTKTGIQGPAEQLESNGVDQSVSSGNLTSSALSTSPPRL